MARRKHDEVAAESDMAAPGGHSSKRRRLSHDEDVSSKTTKKAKKSKDAKVGKSKDGDDTQADVDKPRKIEPAGAENEEPSDVVEEAAVAKKEKNKKKAKGKKDTKTAGQPEEAETAASEEVADAGAGDEDTKPAATGKKQRFIVFVGNLPYSATTADIERHFSAVRPTSVRLLHQRDKPTKSRGVAFVEFAGYDTMKTCLKTLHHSTMTVRRSGDSGGGGGAGRGNNNNSKRRGASGEESRVINVELTAGGGGNTERRRQRIREKNEKLNGERERRAIEEEKAKAKKERERLTKEAARTPGEDGVHPSRRGRVPGKS